MTAVAVVAVLAILTGWVGLWRVSARMVRRQRAVDVARGHALDRRLREAVTLPRFTCAIER